MIYEVFLQDKGGVPCDGPAMDRRVSATDKAQDHPLRGLGRIVSRIRAVLRRWRDRSTQRRALAELDDRLLGDIGVSREAAAREAQKPFWKG